MKFVLLAVIFIGVCSTSHSDLQAGPDPWNYESVQVPGKINENEIPPDLRTPVKKERPTESTFGYGEWWFKRLLAIMLKSGQYKKSDDGSVDVSLQMRFDSERWDVLDDCLKSEATLSDDKFRRTVGYVEEAIYKPTIADQIVIAWSDYIQIYLMEYKIYITLLLSALAVMGGLIWLWRHISHKHVIIIIFVLLYIYEAFISYKEAEQQEFEKFVSAVNTCKWYFWTTDCTVPPPDPLLFIKHMNPLKIGVRMFTSLISEPIIAINSTIKIILHGVTDGLWFPFDKIVYGFSILIVNISLIYLLIMVVFNFIFNIPFNLNFLGIVSIGVRQNRRSMFSAGTNEQPTQIRDTDRISGDRLDRLLNVCSLALTNVTNTQNRTNLRLKNKENVPRLQRSASTGRLPNNSFSENSNDRLAINSNCRKRQNAARGDGDH